MADIRFKEIDPRNRRIIVNHPVRYARNQEVYKARGGLLDVPEDIKKYNGFWQEDDFVRLYGFALCYDLIVKEKLPGDFAEFGVFMGRTAALMADYARRIGKQLYLLDTFEGFSQKDLVGVDATRDDARFKQNSLEAVRAHVGEPNVHYIKGYFPETAPLLPANNVYSMVHMDCDLGKPTEEALKYFYPRMVPGGFIIIHDYMSCDWDGLESAVDEFLKDKPESVIPLPDMCGSIIFRKAKI